MDIERYVELVERIISSDELTSDQKRNYYMMLEKLQKMERESPKNYEDKSYCYRGKKLSEHDRILYELNRLLKYKNLDSTSFKKMAYQLSYAKTLDSYIYLKKKITKLQLKNGVSPSFYSIFESLIEEETKPSKKVKPYEENKVIKKSK